MPNQSHSHRVQTPQLLPLLPQVAPYLLLAIDGKLYPSVDILKLWMLCKKINRAIEKMYDVGRVREYGELFKFVSMMKMEPRRLC
jgi:hypothetical protein